VQSGAPEPRASTTLEHTPAQLPTVTFRDGQLTIVAYNSSLHDVLEMVRTQTGAAMEIPAEATERVFVSLGPGPVRHVLDSLLAGSTFNYVLLGSETDPQALTKVLLTPKPAGNTDGLAVAETAAPARRRSQSASVRSQQALSQQPPSDEVEESTAPIQQASESQINQEAVMNVAARPSDETIKTDNREKTETSADLVTQPNAAAQNTASSQSNADYPRTPNIRTAQEVLQDLYARRRAMQPHPSSPQ
ncbi:MAG TPA: hypothetical protein VG498_17165, partial [Terriglobales bacterium]|nr:hypothetical protein [Terriglobales bacterium]